MRVSNLLMASVLFALTALTGCGSMPSLKEIGQSIREVREHAVLAEDTKTAEVIRSQRGLISYRAATLQGMPKTLAALEQSCRASNAVEVLVYASELATVRNSGMRCVTVYYSDDVHMRDGDNVLMTNGRDVWVNGYSGFPAPKDLAREQQYRRQIRHLAMNFR